MSLAAKICGLSTEESVAAAVEGGAVAAGFVFFRASPRWVSPARAADLARGLGRGVKSCGLFVDEDERTILATLDQVPLDWLQLHGSETPEAAARLRERTGRLVVKAIPVGGPDDLQGLERWQGAADLLLFDARPPRGAALPGGNGVPFDWALLAGRRFGLDWMLSGGLDAENLAMAAGQSGARMVDVSSGVETSPGIKAPRLIRDFLAAARRL